MRVSPKKDDGRNFGSTEILQNLTELRAAYMWFGSGKIQKVRDGQDNNVGIAVGDTRKCERKRRKQSQ